MKIQARLNKISQPLDQQRKALHEAFISAMADIVMRVVEEGLYTHEEIRQMPPEKFRKMIIDYDADKRVEQAAMAAGVV